MKTDDIKLYRDDIILVKYWEPEGFTSSGLWTQHAKNMPSIFAHVVRVPPNLIRFSDVLIPGVLIVFERYAGEEAYFDEGMFYFLHVDDIAAVDFPDGLEFEHFYLENDKWTFRQSINHLIGV